MRKNDLILFAVVFVSLGLGVLAPATGTVFQPFMLYFMMTLLFLSFLRIDFDQFLRVSRRSALRLAILTIIKLIALPVALYYAALFTIPDYAIPVLLLSGISTGVVAPFIATLLPADTAAVLRMVVITSIIAPFSLPALVKLLAGAEITIPLDVMIRLLCFVVFAPIAAVLLVRRFLPWLIEPISKIQYPVSLLLFSVINLGVFSKYSQFFMQHPADILFSLVLSYVLSFIYYVTGMFLCPARGLSERVAASISIAIMNNVLVIVFSSRFFGPLSPLLAAMYMFPFFTMFVPLKMFLRRFEERPDPILERYKPRS
jgi:bile acid:Na+ symporter, BASS family